MKWTRRLVVWPLVLVGTAALPFARAEPASEPGVPLAVCTIKVEGVPHHLLVDHGTLYVSCFHGANLSVVNTRSRRVTR
jgi:hypothetical protein